MNKKVVYLNLENGNPTVDVAMLKLINNLVTYKKQGYKAVIIIHGYGSTGVGGNIKKSTQEKLKESSLKGIVKKAFMGEAWVQNKTEILGMCGSLKDYEKNISGNKGITVVILV